MRADACSVQRFGLEPFKRHAIFTLVISYELATSLHVLGFPDGPGPNPL